MSCYMTLKINKYSSHGKTQRQFKCIVIDEIKSDQVTQ